MEPLRNGHFYTFDCQESVHVVLFHCLVILFCIIVFSYCIVLLYFQPNQEPRSVKQFQVNCWANDSNLPSSKVAMIEVVDLVERWQARTGNGPATIHCM